jgi:hypothetical protein
MDKFQQLAALSKRLVEGAKGDQLRRIEEDNKLVETWENLRLLDNVKTDHRKRTRARLLENQAKYMSRKLLNEATTNSDIQGFLAVAFPAVRRVLDKSLAEEFVAVQALNGPAGLIYYIDYKFDTAKAGVGGYLNTASSVYGDKTGPARDTPLSNLATGGLYQFGSTAFSRREIIAAGSCADAGGGVTHWGGTVLTDNATNRAAVKHDPAAVRALAGGQLVEIRGKGMFLSASAGAAWGGNALSRTPFNLYKADTTFLTAWVPLSGSSIATGVTNNTDMGGSPQPASGSHTPTLYRHLTRTDGSDVIWYFSVSGTAANFADLATGGGDPWNGSASVSFPVSQAINSVSGADGVYTFEPGFATEFSSAANNKVVIPEMQFEITGKTISTEERKMKATWSPEAAQDLSHFFSINAEEAMTQMMTDHMAAEIQGQIISELLAGANAATYFWSRRPGRFLDKTTGQDAAGSPDFTGDVQAWYRTLVETVHQVAAQISKKTVLGQANFAITSPEVGVILRNTMEFRAVDEGKEAGSSQGSLRIGAVNIGTLGGGRGGLKVFEHAYFPTNQILIGFKPEGSDFEEMLGAGYVYAPYVPIIVSPIVADPVDFSPKRMVMSRYATEMLRGDFYGKVYVLDMDLLA